MNQTVLQHVSGKTNIPHPIMTTKGAIIKSLCVNCYQDVNLDAFKNIWFRNEYLATAKCDDCQPRW